jgi:glutaredoxin
MSPHTATVTVVTMPGCHFCDDARQVLGAMADAGAPIRIDLVEATSPAGRALLAAHRPAMNPLVLVDGARFSAGRLPRRKLEDLLARRGTATTQEVHRG